LDKILNIGIEYNKEIPLGVFASPEGEIELTAEFATQLDLNGINEADTFEEILNNIALSVKSGNITFEIDKVTSYYAEFAITVSTENLMPDDSKLEAGISVTLHFKISLNGNGDKQFNTETVTVLATVVVAAAVVAIIVIFALSGGSFKQYSCCISQNK